MKTVLVAPLDWGLGHATRCIPVIRELLSRRCTVYIASSGDALALLKIEFPTLTFFSLPAYRPVYPFRGPMAWKMFTQLPRFSRVIREEHRCLQRILREHHVDAVISDNRYGCWSSLTPSVLITHQYTILPPKGLHGLTGILRWFHERLIRKFSACWIPDMPDTPRLGGLLSCPGAHPNGTIRYIGILSRFHRRTERAQRYDLTCIFSGPEPQRSVLEKKVLDQLSGMALRTFVVRGIVGGAGPPQEGTAHCRNFLTAAELQTLMEQSACILARSGYSTVMDLSRLGKRAILIPTPGQTEQTYLADRLKKMRIAFAVAQRDFDLHTAWREVQAYGGFPEVPEDGRALNAALDELLGQASLPDDV